MNHILFDTDALNGWRIGLRQVLISETYECLLEGKISARTNEFVLHTAATYGLWPGVPSHILGLKMFEANLSKEFPRLMLMGRFESEKPARNSSMMRSKLVLIWFQNEISPLMSPANLAHVKALDWERLAQDYEIS